MRIKPFIRLTQLLAMMAIITSCTHSTKPLHNDDKLLVNDILGKWECVGNDATEFTWGYTFNRDGSGTEYSEKSLWAITYAISRNNVTIINHGTNVTTQFTVLMIDDVEMIVRYNDRTDATTFHKVSNPTPPDESDLPGNTPGSPDSPDTPTDIDEFIARNVHITISYADYFLNFAIESTLETRMPDSEIEFKIAHGDTQSGFDQVISANSHVTSSTSTSAGIKTTKISYPFYYYFIARHMIYGDEADRHAWEQCETALGSLMELNRAPLLTPDQQALRTDLTNLLNSYVPQAIGNYMTWIYVSIDGKHHPVKTYML